MWRHPSPSQGSLPSAVSLTAGCKGHLAVKVICIPDTSLPVKPVDGGLLLQLVGNDIVAIFSVLIEDVVLEGRSNE